MLELIYETHSLTVDNERGDATGWLPGELSDEGRREAVLEPEKHVDVPYPGGESYRDVVDRVASFLDDVRARWDGKRVCVVSHAAPRWALQHLLDGAALEELVGAPFEWQPGWEFAVA